ncbi:MAG: hypothetical protein IJU48_02660 [Synergistaceae bacterium]|nr:hypothetical protein [Synergistaceae bacterium]
MAVGQPKEHSGIKRGKTPDIKFGHDEIRRYETIRNPDGTLKESKEIISNEPFRAILNASDGTRITVHYVGFGSTGTEELMIGMRGTSNKQLVRIREDGRASRSYSIKTVSDVKKHINPLSAWEITIHGRDLRAEAREAKRRERELWREMNAAYKKRQAKQKQKAAS